MNRKFKSIALAGALMMVAAPAFAQAGNTNPFGIDLDPFHIFTPAPPPPQVNIAPPMGGMHRMHRMHRMAHGHKMMMRKKMMSKKMMMHKKMMKK